jgi:hypothetical protein
VFGQFLKDNGIREQFVDAYKALLQPQSSDFDSVFISYSTRDQSFADFLWEQLRLRGIRTWYAPKDMKGGERIIDQVRSAIRAFDRLLLILSPNSIGSDWVENELRLAIRREKEANRRVLFPISVMPFEHLKEWDYVDADTGQDIGHYVRSFYIPDFSDWRDTRKAKDELQRLAKALQRN